MQASLADKRQSATRLVEGGDWARRKAMRLIRLFTCLAAFASRRVTGSVSIDPNRTTDRRVSMPCRIIPGGAIGRLDRQPAKPSTGRCGQKAAAFGFLP